MTAVQPKKRKITRNLFKFISLWNNGKQRKHKNYNIPYLYSPLLPIHCQGQQKLCERRVSSKRPRIFYLKILLVAWTMFLRYLVCCISSKRTFSANRFLTEVHHGEMAKQTEEFVPFKSFSHYIRKNKASEQQNIHCYKNLGNFDEKKQTDVFDKL